MTIIANKVFYCFFGWIVRLRLTEMQVSMTNAKEDASKTVQETLF